MIDSEGAFDAPLAKDIGVDLDKLIIVQPTYPKGDDDYHQLTTRTVGIRTEWFLKEVRKQYGPDKLLTLVWDSLGGTNFDEDIDSDAPQDTRGLSEKRMGRWIRRIRPRVDSTNSLWFIINQVYANVSSFPTAQATKSKGGKAPKFHAKIRIQWSFKEGKSGKIYNTRGEAIGARLYYKIDKNRIGPPWREGFCDWYFDENGSAKLDKYSGLLNYYVSKGLVDKTKGAVKVNGKTYRCAQKGTTDHTIYVAQTGVVDKMLKDYPVLLES